MPWKLGTKTINPGRSWTDANGNQYPTNWLALTTDAEKKAVGLTWEADPTPYDERFYSSASNPKNVVDLKTTWIANTKNMAKSLLLPTDWYVVRKAETDTAVPSNVTTYRTAVRTSCANIETSITNAADHTAFVALWNVPVDSNGNPTGNAPISNWPDPL
tara:strand:+ start:6811 stop:7290 length:480 start_codon:yes stop_codon:yes gene_type:complete